jgi:hypothetical protein
LKAVFFLATAGLLLGSEAWPPPATPAPLVGFSYSPLLSQAADRQSPRDLEILLDATSPDLVRLPVYWESVEPEPATLDFSSVDDLLAVVESYDLTAARPARVVLTVGARNFLYPELHEPAWAAPRSQPHLDDLQLQSAYRDYFVSTLLRYRSSPLLYAWQVENEPLDYVGNAQTGDDQIKAAQLAWEVAEVHAIDPQHEAVITTFDAWNVSVDLLQIYAPSLLSRLGGYPSGHPHQAMVAGDVLGLDMYIDGPSVPLRFTDTDLRAAWKAQAVDFWAGQARVQGKDLWITEMQAQPWSGMSGYAPANLVSTAADYRQEAVQVVLLWGVETWLRDPAWMAAAQHAMDILRQG